MDLSSILARIEKELQDSCSTSAGPPSSSPLWSALFNAVEELKTVGDDYEKANALYGLLMRIVIDHWPNLNDSMPALDALGNAMGQWRRARNIAKRRPENTP
jgi:hypothetical protein